MHRPVTRQLENAAFEARAWERQLRFRGIERNAKSRETGGEDSLTYTRDYPPTSDDTASMF